MPDISLQIIARIHNDFPTKFGLPRQSGLVGELKSTLIFEPEYRVWEAFRGLEAYSHIWLIWQFSQAIRENWSPTVRPPRLGGNRRMGVFATRSPFRPNGLGLSSVRLEKVERDPVLGPVLHLSGADLMDGTPIFDIKPYLPFTDSHPDATAGFAGAVQDYHLDVEIPEKWLTLIPASQQKALYAILAQDPRPSYQQDPARIYGFFFGDSEIRFTVCENRLTVVEIQPAPPKKEENHHETAF